MRRAVAALGAVVVLVGVAVGAWCLSSGDDPATSGAADPEPTTGAVTPEPGPVLRQAPCGDAHSAPFTPDRISVEGVVDDAEVIATPRDSSGVPGVLPLSSTEEFAWDAGGIRPGEPRGNVLLNTHTWPDGSAMGNRLLRDLDLGDRIVLAGEGHELCYEVTRVVKVLASQGYPPYYATGGPPRVAIIVCSGERTGPGEWSHRTMWFARATATDR